jgi:exosortase/archaeosortase family protein
MVRFVIWFVVLLLGSFIFYLLPWGQQYVSTPITSMEAVIILLAAVFAFPATFVQKIIGFVSGFVAIHALNVVRIISLYYIAIWDMKWYEWFHLYVWQMLIILDALLVWLIWLRWINKDKRKAAARAAAVPVAA